MDAFLNAIPSFIPLFFEIAFAVVAVASAIAAVTKTPGDDEIVGKVYRVLDMLALNIGYAKEKPEPTSGGRFVSR